MHRMLICFTYPLIKRCLVMAFCSRNVVLLINNTHAHSRPFDEILCSFDTSVSSMPVKNNDAKFHSTNSFDKGVI